MTFASYNRPASVDQRFKYNQGTGDKQFKTERVSDLGLNWDMTKYRTYDYALGRFMQVDPLADQAGQESMTSYHFGLNNPILNNDPYGDCATCPPSSWEISAMPVVGEAYVEVISEAASGIWNAVTSPIQTVKGLWGAITSPVETATAIKDQVVSDYNADPVKTINKGMASMTIGLLGDKGMSKLKTLGKATDLASDLQKAANQALDIVGEGKGPVHGTKVHSEFGKMVDQIDGVTSEISYKDGQVVPYGTKGSVRADAVAGDVNNPSKIYDLKTGNAKLTDKNIQKYNQNVPNSPPVEEIKPGS